MLSAFENAALGGSDAGVVVDHVDPAPGLVGGREHALHVLAVAHIGLDVQRRVADVRSDPWSSLRVAIGDQDPRSFGGEEPGRRLSDARRAAGDHRHFACQSISHELFLSIPANTEVP